MHLPLRRNTKRAGSISKAAPAPPETSESSGTLESLPHEPTPTPSTTSPQKKGLAKRMTSFSKPVRMLKSMASRSSLRHGRIPSAASVQMSSSMHEGEHEPDVKEETASVDTDYGKELVTRHSQSLSEGAPPTEPERVGDKGKGAEGERPQPAVENVVHEADARQEVAAEQPEEKEESHSHVEQAAASAEEASVVPVAEAATASVASDAKNAKVKNVAAAQDGEPPETGTGYHPITSSAPKTEGASLDPVTVTSSVTESLVIINPDTISFSSSSTSVDPQPHPAAVVGSSNASDKPKEFKMQEEPELAKNNVTDVNPFLVDDPEDPLSDSESQKGAQSPPAVAIEAASPATQSVTLSKELNTADNAPAPLAPVVEQKAVQKTTPVATSPQSSASLLSSSEDEAPELHAPALTVTSLFLPVPHTDPLGALLTKYVHEPNLRPPRDTTGEWQHADFHTLVMTNNWRALARMARDRIVTANPRDVELVLNLWYIRLSSLARLRLFNQACAECENLFTALASIEPPNVRAYILHNVLPFELEVLRARCTYWSGDHLGYLDDVSALLHRCRVQARRARDQLERAMWKERGARMALIVASQLVEMKDYTAATTLLEPLSLSGCTPPSPALRSAIARIYLQGGNLAAAAAHFDAVDADPGADPTLKAMNAVIRSAALGEWENAAEYARTLAEGEPTDVVTANNYAVALLGQGKIKRGIRVLETTLQASPSGATTTEPYLFNLSTMYELRANLTAHSKRDLLIEVAKWSGDGLRTACLKLNA